MLRQTKTHKRADNYYGLHAKDNIIYRTSNPETELHDFNASWSAVTIPLLASMSGRLLSGRLSPLAQRAKTQAARHFHHHTSSSTGGLLRSDAAVRSARQRIWPAGYTPFSNAVAVRNASFVRILPNLILKFARIPALFGGATIAGLAYIQYQATRMLSL